MSPDSIIRFAFERVSVHSVFTKYLSFAFQMFVLVLFWFQLYNGFSGSNAIDDLSLIFFNLLFTAVPPVICGILDKDVPDPILTAKPDLYKSGQNSEVCESL